MSYTINTKVKAIVEGIDKDGFNIEKEMYRILFNESDERLNKEDIKSQVKKLLSGIKRFSCVDVNLYIGESYKQSISKRYCYRGFDGIEFEERTLVDNCYPETNKHISKNDMINQIVEVFMLMNYEMDRVN